jgi:hypothetical protein
MKPSPASKKAGVSVGSSETLGATTIKSGKFQERLTWMVIYLPAGETQGSEQCSVLRGDQATFRWPIQSSSRHAGKSSIVSTATTTIVVEVKEFTICVFMRLTEILNCRIYGF